MSEMREKFVLESLLNDRDKLKLTVRDVFDEIKAERKGLDVGGLESLAKALQAKGFPKGAFETNLEKLYVCFDFNGNGFLDVREATRLVTRCLVEYRNDSKIIPENTVPTKTPEAAGYTTVRVLASGGQGQASLVTTTAGKEVVLKSYSRENENAANLNELLLEVAHMKECGACPNIAHCLDLFQDDSFLYMVSEANYGGDWQKLRSHAEAAGVTMDERWFRGLFEQAFEGIQFMHNHAIVHCDLKEPNLMIRNKDYAQPEVIIIDLGLSTSFVSSLTGVYGTPGYIPPETFVTGLWVPKGDVYSMGVVCYQVLTDQSGSSEVEPFCQAGSTDWQDRALNEQLPLDRITMDLADRGVVEDFVKSLTSKDFRERPTAGKARSHAWFF